MIRLLAIGCALALGTGSGSLPRLNLRVRTGGRIVWSAPIRPGEAFDVGFRHSSEHCDWTHHFVVGPDATIRQLSSTFPCYGPGMPSAVPDGTALRVSGEGFTVAAPLVLRELSMMGSRSAALRLLYRGTVVPLSAMLRDFEPFSVRAEP